MTSALHRYLRALFGRAPADSFVEIRYRIPSGMAREFHDAGHLTEVASSISRLAAMTDVYVGVIPRRHRQGGGRDDLIACARTVWVDCDAPESVSALRRFSPAPSIILRSGSSDHRHAYWLLRTAVGLDDIEDTNRRLAVALGGDPACADAARILRPPSLNHKSNPPTPVTLEHCRAWPPCPIDNIRDQLPPAPERSVVREWQPLRPPNDDPLLAIPPPVFVERLTGIPVPRSGKIACPFHDLSVGEATPGAVLPARSLADASLRDRVSADPLLLVPPPVYFERLTGLRVGRSGKLRCLFHDDRSPSLHVYQEAGRGWCCFGCGRGGSVYDLAALLWGRKTRGGDFLELRRELEKLLL